MWDRGKYYTDIVEITAVCYDNTILNQLNDTSDHPDADLFLLSVEYIELVKPVIHPSGASALAPSYLWRLG